MYMSDALNWEQIRSFHAVMAHASLSAAARQLGCTQPTVGRHISQLEASLGLPLFVRSQHGLTPTDAAHDLVQYADAMVKASAALTRAASGASDETAGTVRLTTSDIVGVEVLPSLLKTFRASHPGITVELALSNTAQDLSRREADIAVRMMRPTQNALVAKKIGDVPVRLYAHETYLEANPAPRTVEELRGHSLIGYDTNLMILDLMTERGVALSRDNFNIRTDNEPAQHAMLRAGLGISGMQEHLARRTPGLVAVLPDEIPLPMEMWLVMHEDLKARRPVRTLFDYLAKALPRFIAGKDLRT
jgi:DNA-binding transcriptional LysR family regulator